MVHLQSGTIALILLAVTGIVAALVLYFSFSPTLQEITAEQPTPQTPIQIRLIIASENNLFIELYNPNDERFSRDVFLFIRNEANNSTKVVPLYLDIPPRKTLTLTLSLSLPPGSYTASMGPISTTYTFYVTSSTPSPVLTDLSITSLSVESTYTFSPPNPHRYLNKILFSSSLDVNTHRVILTVRNPADQSIEVNVSVDSSCLESRTVQTSVGPGESNIIIYTNTTVSEPTDVARNSPLCEINVELSSIYDFNSSNNKISKKFPIYEVIPCGQCQECNDIIYDRCRDTDYVIVLQSQDLLSDSGCIGFPYKNCLGVTYDLNAHEIRGSGTVPIYLYQVEDLVIGSGKIVGESSRAIQLRDCNRITIEDSNIMAYYSEAANLGTLYVDGGSAIVKNSSVETNAGVSLYVDHSEVNVLDSNIAADTKAIYLSSAQYLLLQNSNINANSYAVYSVGTKDIDLKGSYIYAETNFAFYSYCNSCSLLLTTDLADSSTYVISPGYDWYVATGGLYLYCENCGNGYFLYTDTSDKYGSGNLYNNCDNECTSLPP